MYNPYDHYFSQAKKHGYKARSAFKLDEIDQKFRLFNRWVHTVIDIWCSPWSWLQYVAKTLDECGVKKRTLVWFDIKETQLMIDDVSTYVQDIQDHDAVKSILDDEWMREGRVDVIISDMAPNTTNNKSIDALRSIALLEDTLRIYQQYLKPEGKFAMKVFMWPGFDEFVKQLKDYYWSKSIKMYKPASCRKNSKETYIVKI